MGGATDLVKFWQVCRLDPDAGMRTGPSVTLRYEHTVSKIQTHHIHVFEALFCLAGVAYTESILNRDIPNTCRRYIFSIKRGEVYISQAWLVSCDCPTLFWWLAQTSGASNRPNWFLIAIPTLSLVITGVESGSFERKPVHHFIEF